MVGDSAGISSTVCSGTPLLNARESAKLGRERNAHVSCAGDSAAKHPKDGDWRADKSRQERLQAARSGAVAREQVALMALSIAMNATSDGMVRDIFEGKINLSISSSCRQTLEQVLLLLLLPPHHQQQQASDKQRGGIRRQHSVPMSWAAAGKSESWGGATEYNSFLVSNIMQLVNVSVFTFQALCETVSSSRNNLLEQHIGYKGSKVRVVAALVRKNRHEGLPISYKANF
jgi:hypothetical protein